MIKEIRKKSIREENDDHRLFTKVCSLFTSRSNSVGQLKEFADEIRNAFGWVQGDG